MMSIFTSEKPGLTAFTLRLMSVAPSKTYAVSPISSPLTSRLSDGPVVAKVFPDLMALYNSFAVSLFHIGAILRHPYFRAATIRAVKIARIVGIAVGQAKDGLIDIAIHVSQEKLIPRAQWGPGRPSHWPT